MKYSGHGVTHDRIRACPSKIKAIVERPKPASAKEVQRFIGKCQYYRKFIANFSQVAAPLFKAQTASHDFVWTHACDLAWTRLKEALVSDAILVHPDYARDFLLDCDGSGEGLGAVLLQAYDEGERVVAYASRSLLEHEKKWIATELEVAVLIWALEAFRPYIDGVHVTIGTAHAPLEYIRSNIDRCKRLKTWALRLQEIRFTIQQRPGTQHTHMDALSRAPIPVEFDQQPIVLEEFPERMALLVRSWDERVVALPPRSAQTSGNAAAASSHRARLYSALRRRRTPNAENSAASEAPRDTSDTFNGPALRLTGNRRTTGAKWCSPTPKKVTMLTRPWWCRARRRTSLR